MDLSLSLFCPSSFPLFIHFTSRSTIQLYFHHVPCLCPCPLLDRGISSLNPYNFHISHRLLILFLSLKFIAAFDPFRKVIHHLFILLSLFLRILSMFTRSFKRYGQDKSSIFCSFTSPYYYSTNFIDECLKDL